MSPIEEEWGKLMFFCEVGSGRNRDCEKFAIFGSVRGRRGAELKVLSAVKTKVPGCFGKVHDEAVDRERGKEEREGQGRVRHRGHGHHDLPG